MDIDGGTPFACLIAEGGWNGWAMPYFSREVAEQVLAEFGEGYAPSWDGDTLTMWNQVESDDDQEREYVERFTDANGVEYYAIGAGSWIWAESDARTCNGCGDYFDGAADFEAHDCAETVGE